MLLSPGSAEKFVLNFKMKTTPDVAEGGAEREETDGTLKRMVIVIRLTFLYSSCFLSFFGLKL
jgi:hypothetical protein